MIRYILSIVVSLLLVSSQAHADGTVRFIYGLQDQYSNNKTLDRFTFKIIHNLDSKFDVDFRATYANARDSKSTLRNFEIGTRYKAKVADGVILYVRPEIATISITNLPRRDFIGLEVGTLLRPFDNKKVAFKIDHAWTTGLGNKISNGTLSRFQTTYDINKKDTIGIRFDARRGEPVEFNTINFIYAIKY